MKIGDPEDPGKQAMSTTPIFSRLKSTAGWVAVIPLRNNGKLFLTSQSPVGYPTIITSSTALNSLSCSLFHISLGLKNLQNGSRLLLCFTSWKSGATKQKHKSCFG